MTNSLKHSDLPYRKCVGIMLLNQDNKVWVGHRISSSDVANQKLWQMPQGGIDKGENAETAAQRELFEETGISSITLIEKAPDWISYDLPTELLGSALKGKYRGQTQRWFAYRFTGNESEIQINPPPGDEHAEFDQWKWEDLHKLPDLIVPFKRELYQKVVKTFGHLVSS